MRIALLAALLLASAGTAYAGEADGIEAVMAADAECDDSALTEARERHDLGDGAVLHIVPCALYAYNDTSRLFIERDGAVEPLVFEDYASGGWEETTRLFGAYFDSESAVLTSFYKGRGIGDCGSTGLWAWTGHAFALRRMRAMEECEGLLPDEWPDVRP